MIQNIHIVVCMHVGQKESKRKEEQESQNKEREEGQKKPKGGNS
jgi:hypothetical protein